MDSMLCLMMSVQHGFHVVRLQAAPAAAPGQAPLLPSFFTVICSQLNVPCGLGCCHESVNGTQNLCGTRAFVCLSASLLSALLPTAARGTRQSLFVCVGTHAVIPSRGFPLPTFLTE